MLIPKFLIVRTILELNLIHICAALLEAPILPSSRSTDFAASELLSTIALVNNLRPVGRRLSDLYASVSFEGT
jgi:hypothetical protein